MAQLHRCFRPQSIYQTYQQYYIAKSISVFQKIWRRKVTKALVKTCFGTYKPFGQREHKYYSETGTTLGMNLHKIFWLTSATLIPLKNKSLHRVLRRNSFLSEISLSFHPTWNLETCVLFTFKQTGRRQRKYKLCADSTKHSVYFLVRGP